MPLDLFDEDGRTTPARITANTFAWFPAAVVVVAASIFLFAIACLIMWPLHVWIFNNETNLQNHNYQNSYGTQQSWIDAMEGAIQAIPGAVTVGQAASDATDACKDGARVTELPKGDQAWYDKNCNGPALSPSFPYYQGE